MRTTYATCPRCDTEMWARYEIYEGRARTLDSPAEPAELIPVEWGCSHGCETGQAEVQRAVEAVMA